MDVLLFDSPMFCQVALHPRPATMGSSSVSGAVDGHVEVASGVRLGYRLYVPPTVGAAPIVICKFHGNAEVAADYDHGIAGMRAGLGPDLCVALMVVDYRAFGWSEGSLSLTKLGTDAAAVMANLPPILAQHGLGSARVVLHGRSIGSVCAAHIVGSASAAAPLAGVIIESGLTVLTELPMVAQLTAAMPQMAMMLPMLPDPFEQLSKVSRMPAELPLLVLHGEDDEICPVAQGQALYDSAASATKRFERWTRGARGHNDLANNAEYYPALRRFLTSEIKRAGPPPALPTLLEIKAMRAKVRVAPPLFNRAKRGSHRCCLLTRTRCPRPRPPCLQELRTRLKALGVSTAACVEKADYVALLSSALGVES